MSTVVFLQQWVRAREYFGKAISYCTEDDNNRSSKMLWGQFWSSHQRFFKYLCIASKVKRIVCISRQALKNGKCVVIGLQSTGEARTMEQIEAQGATQPGDSLEDFVSTAKLVFVKSNFCQRMLLDCGSGWFHKEKPLV